MVLELTSKISSGHFGAISPVIAKRDPATRDNPFTPLLLVVQGSRTFAGKGAGWHPKCL
ncbi:MAG: hypothetical protein AAB562_02080 [Patescibacteria group bacterium]